MKTSSGKTNIVVALLASVVVFATAAAAQERWWWSQDDNCMDVKTVDDFDFDTYASKPWYVQQQAENWFSERGSKCTKAEYRILEEENWLGYTIGVKNTAVSKSGKEVDADLCAGYDDSKTKSKLYVSQCWLPEWASGDYWVVAYDEDEGYALVSGGKPKTEVKGDETCGDDGTKQCCRTGYWSGQDELWIFSREQNPSEELVEKVRGIAKKKGFSTEVLFDVPQSNCDNKDDIPSVAIENGSFTTLVTALTAADLVDAVSEPNGPLTVFAPTDSAFSALPEASLNCLLRNKEKLQKVLKYHVVSGEVKSTDVTDGLTIRTLSGDTAIADVSDGVIKINESTVVIPDVPASNGVIHAIDAVLLPPDVDLGCDIPGVAIENGSFTMLVAALKAADLVGALSEPNGPYTVFAPTDQAFAALPEGSIDCLLKDIPLLTKILTYHVASGTAKSTDLSDGLEIETLSGQKVVADLSDGVKINESNVVIADVGALNGVIHVIDAVLVPPDVDGLCDIPTVATQNGSFETLVTALKTVDLVGALSQPNGPYTVFAPTDDAFAALPDGLLDCLLNDEPTLTKILQYHVASGTAKSTDLSDGLEIETLLEEKVVADLSDGVKINESNVVIADVGTSNGVIHVIDAVLVPGSVDVNEYLTTCEAKPVCEDSTHWKSKLGDLWCEWKIRKKGKKYCKKKIRRSGSKTKVSDFCPKSCGTCKITI